MSQPEPALRRAELRRPGRLGLLVAAGVVIAVGLCVGYLSREIALARAARDAFPILAGRLRVEGLSERIEISRDDRGIPHVLAQVEADAWFGLGFAHAQDRLAQMFWLRRIALGRTAEVIGESGLAADRLVRTLGIPRLAQAQVARLDPELRSALGAYAAGVEARVARIRSGRVAPPIALAGRGIADETPWTPADSLAVGKLVAWAAGASHERAVVLRDLIEHLGAMGSRPFFPDGDQDLSVAVPLDDPRETPVAESTSGQARALTDLASFRASAWVLPGRHTASGAPILVAELSVRPTAPSLLYEAHVRSGELDAAGVTIPGLPVFWAGRNPDVSWAAAPLPVVTVDLFKETLRRGEAPSPGVVSAATGDDPGTRSGVLYQNGSRWVPVEERYEEIGVRGNGAGEARVERLRVRETRHGPLINSLLVGDTSHEPLSLAWTGGRSGDCVTGLFRVAHARDAAGVTTALESHQEPPVEVVYADREGNVGLQVAGWLPQRTLPSGLSPVPGRLRVFDWRAPIERDALPSQQIRADDADPDVLPTWVISTGARLEEELSGVQLEWLWRSYARALRLRELIADLVAAGPVELRAAAAVQDDVSANADPQLIAALLRLAGTAPALSPEAGEVADLLRSWDGVAGTDSRGAAAYQLLIANLLEEILLPTIGPELMDRYLSLPGVEGTALVGSIVVGAARSGRRGGWTDPEVVSAAVRESLRRTWMSLTYRLGHNRERWTWGRLHTIRFDPFGGDDAAAGVGEDGLGPFPMAGQAESVARAVPDRHTFATRRASTYRMAVDLASPDRMLTTLAPGQSEHPGHPHFDDGIAPWREGRPSLVVTSPFLLEEAAVERLVLEPSR